MTRDLNRWLDDELVRSGRTWVPERFELAFGMPHDEHRDEASIAEPARVDGRFLLRGSIDLVERKPRTTIVRVTDHKTGKNRTTLATIVDGGRVLQPVLYGLALESLTGDLVEEGRLSYCTTAGPVLGPRDSARRAHAPPRRGGARRSSTAPSSAGPWPRKPAREACTFCDFTAICGRDEEHRTRRKPEGLLADLEALRRMP